MPSTPKELKDYARRAKEKEEAKKNRRSEVSPEVEKKAEAALEKRRLEAAGMSELHKKQGTTKLLQNKKMGNLKPKATIKAIVTIISAEAERWLKDKKNDPRWTPKLPAYEMTGESSEVDDGNWLYAVQGMLGRMSWNELLSVCRAGLGMPEFKTTNYSEAFHCAMNIVYEVLGAEVDEEDGVRYVLTDRERTLSLWPVETRKSKVKTKIKQSNSKLKAKDREKEEEEEEEEVEEEEEEEEEGEEEESEEEEKPVKKSKKSAKNVKVTSTGKVQKGEGVAAKPVKVGKLKDDTLIATTSKAREGGGKKGKLYSLVTKKGVAYKKLQAAAVEEGLDKKDVTAWVPMMIKNGFLQTK